MVGAKDKLLEAKDKLLEEKDIHISDGKIKYLQAMNQFRVVYELRDTFDWLLRSLNPNDSSRPGAMFNKLTEEITDKKTGNLKDEFKDIYNELSRQFEVGQYEPSSLVAVQGCYKELNNNMHGSNTIDIPGRSGISCGGKSRQQQQTHAFIAAVVQKLCAERRYVLDPALQQIFVLDVDYTDVQGVVAGARYRPVAP